MSCVLLTDGQQRKTLAAARSLGSRGVRVLVSETTRWTPSGFSRFCSQRLVSPDPAADPAAYFHWLLDTWERYHFDILFPMDDQSMAVAMRYREPLSKLCRLALPPEAGYLVAGDKGEAVAAAARAGLSYPHSVWFTDLDQVTVSAQGLTYPVIIKPRRSSGSRGMAVAHDPSELITKYAQVHAEYPFPIVQEYIPQGTKYDVCLLFNHSSLLRAAFVQKELRGFPIERGPSTLQESIHYPELVDQAVSLMQSLQWEGIAEVEFMVDTRDGRVKFMEINPRFWASVQCATLAGVDFPWLLYQLLTQGDVPETLAYRDGVRCRWSLPGDILHFLTNRQRWAMQPPFFSGQKQQVYDDILSWDDPMPTVGFVLACLRYLPDPKMWKTMFER